MSVLFFEQAVQHRKILAGQLRSRNTVDKYFFSFKQMLVFFHIMQNIVKG